MDILEISKALLDAETNAEAIKPLTELWPDMDIRDAYAIQLDNIAVKVKNGDDVVGMKIGITSRGMMELLGVSEPDFGHLTKKMEIKNGGTISSKELIAPKVEGELAFVLKSALRGPGITAKDVFGATAYVVPAIEIVDSRIENWRIKLFDTVGDNGSSSRFILGDSHFPIEDVDMRLTGMMMEKNGKLLNSGTFAEVMGNPAESVAWLANKLSEFGMVLNEGDVILSGAVTAAAPALKGDTFRVSFHGMGVVEVSFV